MEAIFRRTLEAKLSKYLLFQENDLSIQLFSSSSIGKVIIRNAIVRSDVLNHVLREKQVHSCHCVLFDEHRSSTLKCIELNLPSYLWRNFLTYYNGGGRGSHKCKDKGNTDDKMDTGPIFPKKDFSSDMEVHVRGVNFKLRHFVLSIVDNPLDEKDGAESEAFAGGWLQYISSLMLSAVLPGIRLSILQLSIELSTRSTTLTLELNKLDLHQNVPCKEFSEPQTKVSLEQISLISRKVGFEDALIILPFDLLFHFGSDLHSLRCDVQDSIFINLNELLSLLETLDFFCDKQRDRKIVPKHERDSSKKLDFSVTFSKLHIFSLDGNSVCDVESILEYERLYVSCGKKNDCEYFQPHNSDAFSSKDFPMIFFSILDGRLNASFSSGEALVEVSLSRTFLHSRLVCLFSASEVTYSMKTINSVNGSQRFHHLQCNSKIDVNLDINCIILLNQFFHERVADKLTCTVTSFDSAEASAAEDIRFDFHYGIRIKIFLSSDKRCDAIIFSMKSMSFDQSAKSIMRPSLKELRIDIDLVENSNDLLTFLSPVDITFNIEMSAICATKVDVTLSEQRIKCFATIFHLIQSLNNISRVDGVQSSREQLSFVIECESFAAKLISDENQRSVANSEQIMLHLIEEPLQDMLSQILCFNNFSHINLINGNDASIATAILLCRNRLCKSVVGLSEDVANECITLSIKSFSQHLETLYRVHNIQSDVSYSLEVRDEVKENIDMNEYKELSHIAMNRAVEEVLSFEKLGCAHFGMMKGSPSVGSQSNVHTICLHDILLLEVEGIQLSMNHSRTNLRIDSISLHNASGSHFLLLEPLFGEVDEASVNITLNTCDQDNYAAYELRGRVINLFLIANPRDLQKCVADVETFLVAPLSSIFGGETDDMINKRPIPQISITNLSIDLCKAIFTTNEMAPFAEMKLENLTLNVEALQAYFNLAVDCQEFILRNLSPSATPASKSNGIYQNIISKTTADAQCNQLRLNLRLYSDYWEHPTSLCVELHHSQLIFLQQFILGELVQYFMNNYKWLTSEELRNIDEIEPPPLEYRVQVFGEKSIVYLPKGSQSIGELIAITFSRICFENSYVQTSFDTPETTGVGYHFDNSFGEDSNTANGVSEKFYEISEGCCDDENLIDLIPRIDLRIYGARIFTATQSFYENESEQCDRSWISGISVFQTGHPAFIYAQGALESAPVWEEVTDKKSPPINLQIVIDRAPHKRVLISSDISNGAEAYTGHSEFKLNLQLQQLHLLYSFWYNNMQELPIVFPYSEKELKEFVKLDLHEKIPDLFSDEWKKYIKRENYQTEVLLRLYSLNINCVFGNDYKYYNENSTLQQPIENMFVKVSRCIVQSTMHSNGLTCVSGCANELSITLRERSRNEDSIYTIKSGEEVTNDSIFINRYWGIQLSDEDVSALSKLSSTLAAFQFSVFLTYDCWCSLNIGLNSADVRIADLSILWALIEFFASYFSDSSFGHPCFTFQGACENRDSVKDQCMNLNVCVFLPEFTLQLPSFLSENILVKIASPIDGGLIYKYSNIGLNYSSQQLSFQKVSFFTNDDPIISNLSCAIKYDYDAATHQTSILISSSDDDEASDAQYRLGENATFSKLPIIVPDPVIVQPCEVPERNLAKVVPCDIVVDVDSLYCIAKSISKLVTDSSDSDMISELDTTSLEVGSLSISFELLEWRLLARDPVLGLHMPIAMFYISAFRGTIFDLKSELGDDRGLLSSTSSPNEFRCGLLLDCFADSFNNTWKCWEPLIEPWACQLVLESNAAHGDGISFQSKTPFLFNITSAFLDIVAEELENLSGYGHNHENELRSHGSGRHDSNERYAFSLRNETGETIRYFQGRSIPVYNDPFDYVDNAEVHQLKFDPIETILCNMKSIEQPVFASRETDLKAGSYTLNVQINGFKTVPRLSVDKLGYMYGNLVPLHSDLRMRYASNAMKHVLKLYAEVLQVNGGRQICLKSIFKVTNSTSHPINFSIGWSNAKGDMDWKILRIQETTNIPLSHFYEALKSSNAEDLGGIWFKPDTKDKTTHEIVLAAMSSIKPHPQEAILKSVNVDPSSVEISALVQNSRRFDSTLQELSTGFRCTCPIRVGESMASSFCYVIEVKRESLSETNGERNIREVAPLLPDIRYTITIHPPIVLRNFLPKKAKFTLVPRGGKSVIWTKVMEPHEVASVHTLPLNSSIFLHVEVGNCQTPQGEWTLIHADDEEGENINQQEYPHAKQMLKQFTDKFYEISEPRVPSSVNSTRSPKMFNDNQLKGASKVARVEKVFHQRESTYNFGNDQVSNELSLADEKGQTLSLCISNIRGAGGQRTVTIYCPFWVVNITPYPLIFQEDSARGFVCGTKCPSKIFTIPFSRDSMTVKDQLSAVFKGRGTVLNGSPGVLASIDRRHMSVPLISALLSEDLPLEDLSTCCFMFNFSGEWGRRFVLKLIDRRNPNIKSAFSNGVSLDVITSQVKNVSMHCDNGRELEINVVVNEAPGEMSQYTKVVRFIPKFFVANELPLPIRIWQDSSLIFRTFKAESKVPYNSEDVNFEYESLFGKDARENERDKNTLLTGTDDERRILPEETLVHSSANFIATIGENEMLPFFLPNTTADRYLRIDFGPSWHPTPSFRIESCKTTLNVKYVRDPVSLVHVATRAAAHYDVEFPKKNASGKRVRLDPKSRDLSLGIWFEADSSLGSIIVKGTKTGTLAYMESDIRVGDELLSVDGESTSGSNFNEVMEIIKSKVNNIMKEQFREKSIHLLREGKTSKGLRSPVQDPKLFIRLKFRTAEERRRLISINFLSQNVSKMSSQHQNKDEIVDFKLDVDVKKHVSGSIFLFIKRYDSDNPAYMIRNRTTNLTISFRQRDCYGHAWNSLEPGECCPYSWEEPIKQAKLVVRICSSRVKEHENSKIFSAKSQGTLSPDNIVELDKIGAIGNLKGPNVITQEESVVSYEIEAEGATRVLTVTSGDLTECKGRGDFQGVREKEVEVRRKHLSSILDDISALEKTKTWLNSQDSQSVNEVNQYGMLIKSPNQVLVEVLECRDLHAANLSGLSNPYCVVEVKNRSSRGKGKRKKKTYYVEKTLSPAWQGQSFVFNISPNAVNSARNYFIRVKVKSHSWLSRQLLGKSEIELFALKDQQMITGWFPLTRKTEQNITKIGSDCGSIRLRLQWIHTKAGFIATNQSMIQGLLERLVDDKKRMELEIGTIQTIEQELKNRRFLKRKTRSRRTLGTKSSPGRKTWKQYNSGGTHLSKESLSQILQFSLHKSKLNRWMWRHSGSLQFEAVEEENRNVDGSIDLVSLSDVPHSPMIRARTRTLSDGNISPVTLPQNNDVKQRCFTSPDGRWMSKTLYLDGLDLAHLSLDASPTYGNINDKRGSIDDVFRCNVTYLFEIGLLYHKRHDFFHNGFLTSKSKRHFIGSWVHESLKTNIYNFEGNKSDQNSDGPHVTSIDGVYQYNLLVKPPLSLSPELLFSGYRAQSQKFLSSYQSIVRDTLRSFRSVNNLHGTLEIFPIEASYIASDQNKVKYPMKVYVKMKHGTNEYRTSTVEDFVGSPVWTPQSNDSVQCNENTFKISYDEFEYIEASMLMISVCIERLGRSDETLSMIYLPIRNLLDTCFGTGEDFGFVKWFPLIDGECAPEEGDMGASITPKCCESSTKEFFDKDFTPCIKLEVRWRPVEGMNVTKKLDQCFDGTTDVYSFIDRVNAGSITYLKLDIPNIVLSCIDSVRGREIFSLVLNTTHAKYLKTTKKSNVAVVIGQLQIDNGHVDSTEHVILASSSTLKSTPTLLFMSEKDNIRSKKNIDCYSLVKLKVDLLTVRLEDVWLAHIMQSKSHVMKFLSAYQAYYDQGRSMYLSTVSNSFIENENVIMKRRDIPSRKIFIESLVIDDIRLKISYRKQYKQKTGESGNSESEYDTTNILNSTNEQRIMYDLKIDPIFDLIPTLSDSPIKIKEKRKENVFGSVEEICLSYLSVIENELWSQIFLVVGSVDTLGNPTTIAKTFGTGFKDFLYEPSRAFLDAPTDPTKLGLGVVKGTLSLVSHSTQGVSRVASNLGLAVNKFAVAISMDEKLKKKHAETNRQKKKGTPAEVVTKPFQFIAIGVYEGVSGLFVEPIKGAKEDGAKGAAIGLLRGFLGCFAKPIAGLGNAFSSVSDAVHGFASEINIIQEQEGHFTVTKFKLPHVFGTDKRLLSFDKDEALAFTLLHRHILNKKRKELECILLVEYLKGKDVLLLVTNQRVAAFDRKKNDFKFSWDMEFDISRPIISKLEDFEHFSVNLLISRKNGFGTERKANFESKGISGSFEHKGQLQRIHNIICCLHNNFENISTNESATTDLVIRFKNMSFVPGSNDETISSIFSEGLHNIRWKGSVIEDTMGYSEKYNNQVEEYLVLSDERKKQIEASPPLSLKSSESTSSKSALLINDETIQHQESSTAPENDDRNFIRRYPESSRNRDIFEDQIYNMLSQILENTSSYNHMSTSTSLPSSTLSTNIVHGSTTSQMHLIEELREEIKDLKEQVSSLRTSGAGDSKPRTNVDNHETIEKNTFSKFIFKLFRTKKHRERGNSEDTRHVFTERSLPTDKQEELVAKYVQINSSTKGEALPDTTWLDLDVKKEKADTT